MTEKQYPKLPAPDTHCFDEDTGKDVWSHSAGQMRAYVDADRAMRAAQAAPAAVAVPDDRCQHCVNRSDGFYGSFAPECPLHNDDGTAHTQAALQPVDGFEAWLKREYPWLGPIGDGVAIAREAWSAALATQPQQAAPASQDAEDAARYRWLRERWGHICESYEDDSGRIVGKMRCDAVDGWDVDPESLDAAIDAARAAKEGEHDGPL